MASGVVSFLVFEWEEEKTFWRVRQVFRIFDVLWRYRSGESRHESRLRDSRVRQASRV